MIRNSISSLKTFIDELIGGMDHKFGKLRQRLNHFPHRRNAKEIPGPDTQHLTAMKASKGAKFVLMGLYKIKGLLQRGLESIFDGSGLENAFFLNPIDEHGISYEGFGHRRTVAKQDTNQLQDRWGLRQKTEDLGSGFTGIEIPLPFI